jgi:hypothetical protein
MKKKKKYHAVGTIPKSNMIIVERDKIDTSNTQINDCLFTCLHTSIRTNEVKLDSWYDNHRQYFFNHLK